MWPISALRTCIISIIREARAFYLLAKQVQHLFFGLSQFQIKKHLFPELFIICTVYWNRVNERDLFDMKLLLKVSVIMLMLASHSAIAADSSEADIKQLRTALAKFIPQPDQAVIKPTPVKGLYQVLIGAQVAYMTSDAKYLIDGDMMDMENKVNLTEAARGSIRKKALSDLGEENMLVYKPKGETKQTITVFTDIYCPYCRKLHNEMDEYMNNGVKVRYIFLPFKGKKSYDASVSVWCAKDRNAALDDAKAGGDIEQKTCEHPIDKHKAMASTLSIRGTPAIMTEDGQLTPGYVPAGKLIEKLKAEGKL